MCIFFSPADLFCGGRPPPPLLRRGLLRRRVRGGLGPRPAVRRGRRGRVREEAVSQDKGRQGGWAGDLMLLLGLRMVNG